MKLRSGRAQDEADPKLQGFDGSRVRQLVSSDEAMPAERQLTKPCSDCPWARSSFNGWLGNLTADEWLQVAHGESTADCHAFTGDDVGIEIECAGLAIYRANVGKRPRDLAARVLPADRRRVFASPVEFREHHARTPGRRKRT